MNANEKHFQCLDSIEYTCMYVYILFSVRGPVQRLLKYCLEGKNDTTLWRHVYNKAFVS